MSVATFAWLASASLAFQVLPSFFSVTGAAPFTVSTTSVTAFGSMLRLGGSTLEAQQDIAASVSGRLIKLMNNGSTTTAVNVPEVELPRLHGDHHRVLHFHHNVPGVLGQINNLVAELGANIAAEHLQTDARHAYAILDVSPHHGEALRDRLATIPETIRVRTLW